MSERKVLRVSGPDAEQFLQGLVTNDVMRVKDGPVYAAMLTPQGKYRADFFLVADGDDILIDVAQPLSTDLLRALTMYKLRAKVTVAETDLTVSRGPGAAPDGAFDDPRDPRMGWRAYDGRPSVETDWDALRVDALIPESEIELTPDTFILEAGFERLSGVDFKKGCYVGQEVTARMKHKTELRKGLATVTVDGTAPIGTPILSGDRPAGVLYTQSGGRGIAYLRFDRATGALTAADARLRYTP
ncbi:aminomethyltransferase [Salipiger aestuarii]|uniref:CAF17-like 4Fe-4S cluster assembly/insertion protein YgfZ n=1 Tax=Salipiger aestuarii TaxID=568098 RepID=UPI00025B7CF4|nr:folate-binding protein YgfZ [Salipiger aestuarii]EIE52865.1 glycine cleavage T protein (aminomethyl transferase) [Citreicella sp. 357]KAA8605779.1 aminomethyltransferase [Salipiger aestuarii]